MVGSLQLNVSGHHPKRRRAAHSKGAELVRMDCDAARRYSGSPGRFALPIPSRKGGANPPDEPSKINDRDPNISPRFLPASQSSALH